MSPLMKVKNLMLNECIKVDLSDVELNLVGYNPSSLNRYLHGMSNLEL